MIEIDDPERRKTILGAPGTQVSLGFSHPRYGHVAVLPQEVRAELANDFD